MKLLFVISSQLLRIKQNYGAFNMNVWLLLRVALHAAAKWNMKWEEYALDLLTPWSIVLHWTPFLCFGRPCLSIQCIMASIKKCFSSRIALYDILNCSVVRLKKRDKEYHPNGVLTGSGLLTEMQAICLPEHKGPSEKNSIACLRARGNVGKCFKDTRLANPCRN